MGPKLAELKERQIINEYNIGELNIKEIAAYFKVCEYTVYAIIKRNNLPRRKRVYKQRKPERNLECLKLYNRGMSIRQIAKKFGVHDTAIYKSLKHFPEFEFRKRGPDPQYRRNHKWYIEWVNGKSYRAIAQESGVNRNTVMSAIWRHKRGLQNNRAS